MSNFKKRLSEAVNKVFSKLDAMSVAELKEKCNNFSTDKRTSAILYAWNSESPECYDPVSSSINWTVSNTVGYMTVTSICKQSPTVIFDHQFVEIVERTNDCYSPWASDDYFPFQAAA